MGTQSAYANAPFNPTHNRYFSLASDSFSSTGATWSGWRLYRCSISRAQLLNAINDVNSKYGAGLSTNPADYRLILFTLQDEISQKPSPWAGGWLSMSACFLYVYEVY